MSIYDGSQSQPLPVNLWNREVPLNSISNGLQFSPSSTEETISTFESLYQRPFTYTYDRDSTAVGEYDSSISIKVFVERDLANPDGDQLKPSPANTLNLGPAFNLNYVIGKQGCINCDSKLTSKVLVNQKPYSTGVNQIDLFETHIEPVSGFMIKHVKAFSVFINLKDSQCLPFPSLDKIGQQLIPIYDVYEEQNIDTPIVSYSLPFSNSMQF